jgi:hypothetical protein
VIIKLMLAVTLWQADSLTATQVRASYPEFISLNFQQIQDQWGYWVGTDTLATGHPLAGFVKERKMYLLYLAQTVMADFPDAANANLGRPAFRDSLRVRFYQRLQTDTSFDRLILGPIASYLRGRGGFVSDYAPAAPVTVPLRRAVAVAARFYNPDVILPDGKMGVHICVVKHGLFEGLGARDLAVEAVAFAAVWDDVSLPDSVAFAGRDFNVAFKRVGALPRTAPPADRVARAQETMWRSMEAGDGLPKLLQHAASQWNGLPFTLRP